MAEVAEAPVEDVPAPAPETEATPEQEAKAEEPIAEEPAPEAPPAPEPEAPPAPPMSIEEKWKADEDARMAQVNGASDPWNDPEPVS